MIYPHHLETYAKFGQENDELSLGSDISIPSGISMPLLMTDDEGTIMTTDQYACNSPYIIYYYDLINKVLLFKKNVMYTCYDFQSNSALILIILQSNFSR